MFLQLECASGLWGLYSGVSLSVGGFLTSLAVVISPALARVLFKEVSTVYYLALDAGCSDRFGVSFIELRD